MPDLAPGEGLRLGSGIIRWMEDGETTFHDIGEFELFEVTPEVTKREYRSNKQPGRPVVKSLIGEKRATCRLVTNTVNAANMAMAMGGSITTVAPGHSRIGFLSQDVKAGVLQLEGTNTEGLLVDYQARIEFAPADTYSPISEEFNALPMSGEVLADENGNFGTWDVREQSVAFAPPEVEPVSA